MVWKHIIKQEQCIYIYIYICLPCRTRKTVVVIVPLTQPKLSKLLCFLWPRYVFLYVTLDSISFLLNQSSGLEGFDDLAPDWLGSLRILGDDGGINERANNYALTT